MEQVAGQARGVNACQNVFAVTDRAEHERHVRFRGQHALEDVDVELAVLRWELGRRHAAQQRPA
jgi:hypothetical protein